MQVLVNKVNKLKVSNIGKVVRKRLNEFKEIGLSSNNKLFQELCYCLLTANFNAEKTMKIQSAVNNGFLILSEKQLAKRLKELGHRFPNARARYIVEARKNKCLLKKVVSFDSISARNWLVKNIKGLGLKEASHFLRNVGHQDLAILDFHILDLLEEHNLIKKPKNLSKKKYFEIENKFRLLASKARVSSAELDLYLWFIETGKILK